MRLYFIKYSYIVLYQKWFYSLYCIKCGCIVLNTGVLYQMWLYCIVSNIVVLYWIKCSCIVLNTVVLYQNVVVLYCI